MNTPNIGTPEALSAVAKPTQRLDKPQADSILLELWETKRELNAQAKFDIAQLANQANAFSLENALSKLNLALAD